MNVIAAAKQSLHSIKDFSISHIALSVAWMGEHKKLWGDTAGTADHNWPKGCFMPYDIVISNKSYRRKRKDGGWEL